jgi:pyridoxal 5'-phosphate synthase pdxT subunit
MMHIGVLALQGAFAKHEAHFQALGAATIQVRKPADLRRCAGLVIPGGESTTLTKLMHLYGFYEPIREFAQQHPVMGTCAGLILLATKVDDARVTPLGLLDIAVSRNAYGRQIDSFSALLDVPFLGNGIPFRTIFIRAPQITAVGPEVEVVLTCQGLPVMVRHKHLLGLAFHPELTDDLRIHQYFLSFCAHSAQFSE